jgi:hypothetical protein
MHTNHSRSACLVFAASLLVCLLGSSNVFAFECPCARCGHAADCQKVCRLVTETKKVEVICWGYKDEDFCVPCPSDECEQHCETACVDCEKDSKVESQPKAFDWTRWLPTSAESYTRRKLMKRVTTKEVPSFKWVYEDICEKCANATPVVNPESAVRVATHEGSVTAKPASPSLIEATHPQQHHTR